MATRSTPRTRSAASAAGPSRKRTAARDGKAIKAPPGFEDVEARAARLGVTVEKVLREYARIAFADPRQIIEWDAGGLHVKDHLSKANAAPIQEIVSGEGKRPARVKLYDKKAALDAIARHLGMFPTASARHENEAPNEAAEDPREKLARLLDRLAPEGAKE